MKWTVNAAFMWQSCILMDDCFQFKGMMCLQNLPSMEQLYLLHFVSSLPAAADALFPLHDGLFLSTGGHVGSWSGCSWETFLYNLLCNVFFCKCRDFYTAILDPLQCILTSTNGQQRALEQGSIRPGQPAPISGTRNKVFCPCRSPDES